MKVQYFEHREYQHYLLEMAKKENLIACLPTGSGKTYIALKLIEHFNEDLLNKKKKVFFLANTIPLVNQQAAFFARHTILDIRHITGDMEVDYWSEEKWKNIIDGFHVMAMTAQIFLNLVRHGYIKFSQVALIVFDECHHAVKEHPMNQIMKEYHRTKNTGEDYALPKILGLSATIIKGNCKPQEVADRVKELETTMDSIAVTYKDYEEVMQNSTNARVDIVKINDDRPYEWYPSDLLAEITDLSKSLQQFRNEKKKEKLALAKVPIEGIHSTLRNANNLYLTFKNPSPGDLKTALDDVRHAYEELGPYCAVIAINLRLAFIDFSLMDLNSGKVKEWYRKVKMFLVKMRNILIAMMSGHAEKERAIYFTSPKLKTLVDIICQFRNSEPIEGKENINEDESLCGLVFVDRRGTAQVLAWYLKDLSIASQNYSFIRANFVVGTSRCPFETVESRIYAKKQTETINKFRSKKLNILTATSVLEEGIDVPSCNLVVRFDPIPTYTSYIQSMGRARKKNATYIVLIKPDNYYKEVLKIDTFKKIHECLVAHLQKQVRKVDSDSVIKSTFHIDELPPLCPGGTADSPRITMDSALEVIDRYCMMLPCDGVSTLHTISWFQQLTNGKYQAFLKLPMNSAVKGVIPGIEMIDKDLARQAVFLEGAKCLNEAGILDEKLVPMHPTFPAKVEAFFNILAPTTSKDDDGEVDKEEGEIVEKENFMKKAEWFKKKECKALSGTEDYIEVTGNSKKYHIVRLSVETTNQGSSCEQNVLYKLDEQNYSFGLLTAKEIPDVEEFPLYGAFGCLKVSLQHINKHVPKVVNSSLVDKIIEFQEALFREILDLRHPLFLRGNHTYLIVPLIKVGEMWEIYKEFLDPESEVSFTQLSTCQNLRPKRRNNRQDKNYNQRRSDYQSRTSFATPAAPKKPKVDSLLYESKYKGRIVIPWYKKKPYPLYLVDSVALDMTPMYEFYDGMYSNFKDFIFKQFKTEIEDVDQPMLKCKLAGIGKGQKQLNYLLKKYAKEDEFPVYLVPELCYILSVPASLIVHMKLLPSILHRLSRLLLAKEIMEDIGRLCAWPGALKTGRNVDKEIEDLTHTHDNQSANEEERRQTRIALKGRNKPIEKPIQDAKNLENRELHYEFIHPNQITSDHIKLFHTAVSIQHAAKKLTIDKDVEIHDHGSELSPSYKTELIDPGAVNLKRMEVSVNLEEHKGPSLIAIMEAISVRNSNEGISNNNYKDIGMAFLNYSVSQFCFSNFPAWNEPLLCQLRNRLLSIKTMCAIAKKRNIAEILSGSYFYPNDTWLPPGVKLPDFVGEIAAAGKVHLGVYDKIIRSILSMTYEDLERHVMKEASEVLSAPPSKGKHIIKHSTYTHSEISDMSIANGVNALVGAFFTQCGPIGAFKFLEWIDFKCPDLQGNDLNLPMNNLQEFCIDSSVDENAAVERMMPGLKKFEDFINYKFSNKKLILEAFTHPSYPANSISDCYQRLEFLGDSILDLLITNHVHTSADPKLSYDQLKDVCSALINNITYGSLAVRYGFHKHLLSMSQALVDMIDNFVVYQEAFEHQVVGHFTLISDEECWGPKHMEVPKVLGDIFEAVAGAIYLDSNQSLDTVWTVYFRLMQNEIDNFLEDPLPKSPLHELKNKFGDELELHNCTSKKIKARGRNMCKIKIGEYGSYFGCGTSLARAKVAAAKIALKMMKEEDDFTKDQDVSKIMLLM